MKYTKPYGAFCLLLLLIGFQPACLAAAPSPARLETIVDFHSAALGQARKVLVWLPPGYDASPRRRYPVLYLHDGQNVFDGATAFKPGQEWRADETADSLVRAGRLRPLIMVAVYNGGEQRTAEYTPTPGPKGEGGRAEQYARMLIEELKPLIDKRYCTRPEAEHTGVGGSSLGGLLSLHLVLRYPQVFGRAAVLSPSGWWDNEALRREVEAYQERPRARLWVDMGLQESEEYMVASARRLAAALSTKGWQAGQLRYWEDPAGEHSELSWARRFGQALQFLY